MRLEQQFLWSALQALEKYFKAILLFNGLSSRWPSNNGERKVKEFNHDISRLRNEIASKITYFDLDIPNEEFFAYIAKYGSNRYFTRSSYVRADSLDQLDEIVWHVRRYCQHVMSQDLIGEDFIDGLCASYVNYISQQTPNTFSLQNGELEKIILLPRSNEARKTLLWQNRWYGKRKRKNLTYTSFSSLHPSTYEWIDMNPDKIKEYVRT